MATYYVTTVGNDGNTGLVPSTPWTLAKAFLSAVAGDIVYIAPGTYRGAFTLSNSGTSGSPIQFLGDPLVAQGWTGINAGQVRITNITDDLTGTAAGATVINGSVRSWISFSKIAFECIRIGTIQAIQLSFGWSITQCQIVAFSTNSVCQTIGGTNVTAGTDLNLTFTHNVVATNGSALYTGLVRHTSAYGVTVNIKNCIFFGHNTSGESFGIRCFASGTGSEGGGYTVQNCTFVGFTNAVAFDVGNTTFKHSVTNSSFIGSVNALASTLGATVVTENFNRILAQVIRNGFPTGASTSVVGSVGVEYGYNEIVGLPATQMVSSIFGSPNTGFGTATGALATDLFSVAWTGATPDAGAATYATISALGPYQPTERNASTITIAPGSTSQSIELYLGATGLTASTAGLSAYFNRTRTASVSITLVARTIAQAWTSGGFAEVDATNMPGVYRLDVPDAALAAGADDVTIVVRGASGTNGAVMTVKLSSGGLTSAQTGAAVWGTSPAGYTNATTFGGVIMETNQLASGIDVEVQDIPGNVWDELKVNHTIPNTFGDYLDTKVSTGADTARIQLRQGPFLIKQNAIDSVITEVNQFLSTVPNIEMVLIDSSGGSVSVAGATLVMRVRNQAGTAVVNNITPTVAYADGGVIRWSPNLSWNALTVTTPGTYRIVVERTMSGVTTTFGPFLVQLSSG